MELALSLGETQKQFSFIDNKSQNRVNKDLGFYMGLGRKSQETLDGENMREKNPPTVQLDLLPFSPLQRTQTSSHLRFPWLTENLMSEPGSLNGPERGVEEGLAPSSSSPNSTVSSFGLDFSMYNRSGISQRDLEIAENELVERERGSDDEDNGSARKKLRLTKDQSAFLEESFKQHNTLNPKQKQALAKKLNLRPRQVEVWFQNRRARTKLKQTEVDCEYLKRCCETLTEENKRLQKELQELRALKTCHPFYRQLPATTLTMCPSCERVATTTVTTSAAKSTTASIGATINATVSLTKPRLHPFLHATPTKVLNDI